MDYEETAMDQVGNCCRRSLLDSLVRRLDIDVFAEANLLSALRRLYHGANCSVHSRRNDKLETVDFTDAGHRCHRIAFICRLFAKEKTS